MIAAALLVLLQGAPQDTALARLQQGVSVSPETVTVGEHFQIAVRVAAPRGAVITFPPEPDTTGPVEAVDPPLVQSAPDAERVDQTARYRLVAWDTGSVAVPLSEASVALAGEKRPVPLTEVRVYVRSVLPPDTAQHVPKPARSIFEAPPVWWPWLLALLAALILLALLAWWWRRRRRTVAPPVAADPLALAEQEFARIDALGLIEAGERGRFVALYVEGMRAYLAARFAEADLSLTSTELLAAMHGRRELPMDRLRTVLAEADLIKFAARPVTAERARHIAAEVRGIVHDTEQAVRETAEPARAA